MSYCLIKDVNIRKWKIILWESFVKISEVCVDLNAPIGIRNRYHARDPLEVINGTNELGLR